MRLLARKIHTSGTPVADTAGTVPNPHPPWGARARVNMNARCGGGRA